MGGQLKIDVIKPQTVEFEDVGGDKLWLTNFGDTIGVDVSSDGFLFSMHTAKAMRDELDRIIKENKA